MITIEQIKKFNIPLNISRANNLPASLHQVAIYNASINLYDAIKLVANDIDFPDQTPTNLSISPDATSILLGSSTGTDVTIDSATNSLAGLLSAVDKGRLDNLVALVGTPGVNLGVFTGSIIPNGLTVKEAFQELEDYLENAPNGIYSGSGTVPTATTATLTDSIAFTTTNASGSFLANVGSLAGSNLVLSVTEGRLRFFEVGSINEVLVYNGGINLSTATPDRVTIIGTDATYAADYSSTYTDRSLVDKAYVDAKTTLSYIEIVDNDHTVASEKVIYIKGSTITSNLFVGEDMEENAMYYFFIRASDGSVTVTPTGSIAF